MNLSVQEMRAELADEFAARLEAQERAYRQRKTQRAFRGLADAAGQLRARMAGRPDVTIEHGERAVTIVLSSERAVELTLRISFDQAGEMQQWYVVREQLVRREHGYEEIDRETVHTDLPEAVRRMLSIAAIR